MIDAYSINKLTYEYSHAIDGSSSIAVVLLVIVVLVVVVANIIPVAKLPILITNVNINHQPSLAPVGRWV